MRPQTAIKTGFANALQFQGRSRRPECWWFFAFVFVGAGVIGAIEALLTGEPGIGVRVFQAIIFVPFLTVGWRRLQDTGRPGWYLLIPVAVVLATWLMIGAAPAYVMPEIAVLSPPPPLDLTGTVRNVLLGSAAFAQAAAGLVIVWWMSRPSERGENAFGPEPRVR